jgi:hypothetical protein
MVHTVITSHSNLYQLTLDLPNEYLGEELDVIIFKKKEGFVPTPKKYSLDDFWGCISDDTAGILLKEVQENKSGWESRLEKQL